MRLLQVVHDFLPRHLAGVEVYTDELSRRLSAEHEVAILTSEVRPERPDHSLERREHGEVALFEVVNNHRPRRFEETYRNPAVDARVAQVLDEFRPDLIHVQHLLNLSLGLVDEARRRDIPVVMTLHDHWLECAQGGQRFHRRLGRCEVLDPERCGPCAASRRGPARGGWLAGRLPGAQPEREWSLMDRRPARIDTADKSYVYRDVYELDGTPRPTWVAHPPARLVFKVDARAGASFSAAIAMHPDSFEPRGGAVRFSVSVDGREVFSREMDPKQRAEDRAPVPLRIPLGPGRVRLELRTDALDEPLFCTGGWVDPRIELSGEDPSGSGAGGSHPLSTLVRWPGRVAERRRIEARWAAVRSMASRVDRFIAPSRYLRNEFIRFGFDPDRIEYCDYGFRIDARPARTGPLPETARRFLFVGSLVEHKGVHILLEAFKRLPENAELRVVGSFDYDPDYAKRLREAPNHPGVRFLGQVPNPEIAGVLAEADTLVVPSIWNENSPLTIHEAFLAGVPVVASRLGGNEGLLAEGGGLLYAADEPDDLATQLLRLTSEPGLLRELATKIPRVKPMEEHVEELVELYGELTAERGVG